MSSTLVQSAGVWPDIKDSQAYLGPLLKPELLFRDVPSTGSVNCRVLSSLSIPKLKLVESTHHGNVCHRIARDMQRALLSSFPLVQGSLE